MLVKLLGKTILFQIKYEVFTKLSIQVQMICLNSKNINLLLKEEKKIN